MGGVPLYETWDCLFCFLEPRSSLPVPLGFSSKFVPRSWSYSLNSVVLFIEQLLEMGPFHPF